MNGPDLDLGQHVDGARLRADLETLAAVGAHPDGGLHRPGLGEACRRAREWFRERMVEADLEVRSDPAANLFGRRPGSDPDAPTLLLASPLDTVPRGGAFDGALGCVGALEVIRTLSEREADLRHPVEVVAWSDEEGVRFGPGLFGSRAATEGIEGDELKIEDDDAIPLSVALEETGGDPDRLPEARLDPTRVACYLELHVEQGPVLDRAGESVGVVAGIVGISRWIVVAEGAANHAGTTPMRARRDSLVASARLAAGARNRIRGTDGAAVGNVG